VNQTVTTIERNRLLSILCSTLVCLLLAGFNPFVVGQEVSSRSTAGRGESTERSNQKGDSESPSDQTATADGAAVDLPNQVELTVDELEQSALIHHPAIIAARSKVDAARGACIQAGLKPNPSVGFVGNELGNEGHAGQNGFYFERTLIRGGKLEMARCVAAQDIAIANWELVATEARIKLSVRKNFIQALSAQRGTILANDSLSEQQRALDLIRKNVETKEGKPLDIVNGEMAFNQVRLSLHQAMAAEDSAMRQLLAAAAMIESREPLLAGSLEAPPELAWEECRSELLANSPALGRAQATIERTNRAIQFAQIEMTPDRYLQAGVQYDDATNFTVGYVQVGQPILINNRNQGNILKSQAEFQSAIHQLREIELDLTSVLAQKFEAYAAARSEIDHWLNEILPRMDRAVELTELEKKVGDISEQEVVKVRLLRLDAEQKYLASLQRLWNAYLDVQVLIHAEDRLATP
jgi:outer membrane protein, heavy metal efflux system